MSYLFGEKTWEELKTYIERDALIILPVGEVEEHSLYLPVDTDTRIATFLAGQIAEEIEPEIPVLVMPTVWSGYTPTRVTHWPGGIQVRIPVFIDLIHDICASIIHMGFNKLLMLDCHGQHAPMLNCVTKMIADEYEKYFVVASPFKMTADEFNEFRKSVRGGVSHAGEWETSMLLYCSPELVRREKFTNVDHIKYHSKFVAGDSVMGGQKVVWSSWGLENTKNGALGDPTCADAETGKKTTLAVRESFRAFIRDYYNYNYNYSKN